MSTALWVLGLVAAWTLLPLPFAVLVGRVCGAGSRELAPAATPEVPFLPYDRSEPALDDLLVPGATPARDAASTTA